MRGTLFETSMARMDRWWDDDAGMLWNPPGAYEEALTGSRQVHLVRETVRYALGLLAGDRELDRAVRALTSVVDRQFDVPGSRWHGTFPRFAEEPVPKADATEWVDFDPNWRQFVGTVLELCLRWYAEAIPPELRDRIERALRLCVAGEPPGRVDPGYSNIALMKAWLDVAVGERFGEEAFVERGERLAAAVVERFDVHGAFEEYNSPTYYGVDLYGLGLWRREGTERLRAWGERLEAALWRDVAAFYHADLRNLAGPYTRAYGMDMSAYVANLGLWMWEAVGAEVAPVPVDPGLHTHDLCDGPLIALLGPRVPPEAEGHLRSFAGERVIERRLGPERVATAWIGDRILLGGERGTGWGAWYQYHPATVHWALPEGGVGWIRLVTAAAVEARASPGVLEVVCGEHLVDGRVPVDLHVSAPGLDPGNPLALPGLDLDLGTNANPNGVTTHDGVLVVRYAPHPGPEPTRFRFGVEDEEET